MLNCPRCEAEIELDDDGLVPKHLVNGAEYGYCRRGGFPLYSSEGWIVLVGQGYPAPVDDEMSGVAHFADEAAALRWIEEHPRAKTAVPAELKGIRG